MARASRPCRDSGRKPPDSFQISANPVSRTEGKTKPGRLSAAWHGKARPAGLMLMKRRPQPPMQAFGRVA